MLTFNLRNKYIFGFILFFINCLNPIYIAGAETMNQQTEKDIILVGASVGNGWKFPELPNRKGINGFKLEFIPVFDSFDKSPAIESIVKRDKKPDVVIIKECSVYFPGDFSAYKQKVEGWVKLLEENRIQPVLATSVPPGKPEGFTANIKGIIKNIIGKPDKLNSVIEYNDWLKSYAKEHNLIVLDIEAALHISDNDRYLNPMYDRGDKVHVNPDAYRKLDDVAEKFLYNFK